MMNDNNDKKRPLTYYYMLMLVLILVFNSVIMPMFFNPKMKEVSYNNFLQMVDEGKVSKVEITDKRLAAVDKNNEKEIYVTGRVEDPELANRLMKSKVEFTQVVPKEQSPLVTFFTNWVLPILIFFKIIPSFYYFCNVFCFCEFFFVLNFLSLFHYKLLSRYNFLIFNEILNRYSKFKFLCQITVS